ncbi:MAG: hypothetical protein ACRCTA_01095 [Bacilli bacterium]
MHFTKVNIKDVPPNKDMFSYINENSYSIRLSKNIKYVVAPQTFMKSFYESRGICGSKASIYECYVASVNENYCYSLIINGDYTLSTPYTEYGYTMYCPGLQEASYKDIVSVWGNREDINNTIKKWGTTVFDLDYKIFEDTQYLGDTFMAIDIPKDLR